MLLSRRDNKRGQVLIINLIFLVMTLVVFVAMIPVLKTTINDARHQDALNCESNLNDCSTNPEKPCYNSSKIEDATACAMVDLYIPYIVIIILIAAVAKLMANKVESFVTPQQQQPYYGGY